MRFARSGRRLPDCASPTPDRPRAERAQPRFRRHQRRALAHRGGGPRDSGCSPPPSTTASSPTPTRSGSAARSTGTRSCAPTAAATSSRPGARSPTPTAASPATPTARRGRPPRPGASSGARATTRSSPSSAATATATRPATSPDAPFDASTPHGAADQRQRHLRPLLRHLHRRARPAEVPQPALRPRRLGGIGGWEGYAAFLSDDPASPDSRLNRLWDGSVEPPFRIGMACGACHIAYDPKNPPADPAHPALGEHRRAGRQPVQPHLELLGSGLSPHRLEWQLIARARPGIVDTSALPMDFVSNPGTMNAIINFARRPLLRGAGAEVAQGLRLRRRRRARRLLVRAGPRRQVLGEEPQDRDGARTSSRAARTRSATRRRSSASTSTSAPAPSSAGSTT